MEGQKKAMSFWAQWAEQAAQPFQAKTDDPVKAGQELLQDWYAKQQAFFAQALQASPQDTMAKAPEHFQQYMDMQTDFAKKWAGLMKWPGGVLPTTDSTRFFTDGMANWKKWMEGGQQWMSREVMGKLPFNMQPHYSAYLDSYQFLHKYWEPLQQLMRNGLTAPDMVSKYFSPDAYQTLVNQMMGFRPVGNVSSVIDQASAWFSKAAAQVKAQWSEMASVSEAWGKQAQQAMGTGELPFFEMAAEFNNRLRDQLAPFNNIAAQGRQNEMSKLLQDIQFEYMAFILKSAEMQMKVYESGQFALPDTIRSFAEKAKAGDALPDFQAFFSHYVNQLEEAILEVLHGQEYSTLQSEVSALATQVNFKSGRLMELAYADMPFLTHSDGDDIAKEASALRQKVRSLEQRLAALEKTTGQAAAAPEKPAGSKKKKLMDKLGTASVSDADDLKQIKGVGPKLEGMLNEIGIYTFRQISKMGEEEYRLIDEALGAFQGRASRDKWAKQAQQLLRAGA